MTRTLLLLAAPLAGFVGAAPPPAALPFPAEMAAARADVWGEAALRHPGGPSAAGGGDAHPRPARARAHR